MSSLNLISTILIPFGKDIINISIYVADSDEEMGLWNIDNNRIFLSREMYQQFSVLKDQKLQRKFFDSLKKVSKHLIV